jgi:hypothetical protein
MFCAAGRGVMRVEQIGGATLYLGDAADHIAALSGCVAVLTDPPYGINYSSGYRTDALWDGDSIHGDISTAVRDYLLSRLHGLPMLVFGSRKAPLPPMHRATLIWDKGPALGMGALDIPWKPSTEEIYVLGKGFVGGRDEGAVIAHAPVQSMAKNGRKHPNEKPVGLLRRLMQKLPAGAVADPFMGSGSTGVACVIEGRAFVGCEIVERYFDIACKRIEQAYRQADMFVGRSVAPAAKPTQAALFTP